MLIMLWLPCNRMIARAIFSSRWSVGVSFFAVFFVDLSMLFHIHRVIPSTLCVYFSFSFDWLCILYSRCLALMHMHANMCCRFSVS